MAQEIPLLANLVNMEDPEAVYAEAVTTLKLCKVDIPFDTLRRPFEDVVALFNGEYPGYQACNTEYHDLKHTTDVFLCMARLIHGAAAEGKKVDGRLIVLGLTAALLHDAGYIQTLDDLEGTGAKYTSTHVQRSIEFAHTYLPEIGWSEADCTAVELMILCTDLPVDVNELEFPAEDVLFVAQTLAAADLLGQMADRTYLEKLLLLFREFEEGEVPMFSDEWDLLEKTTGFSKMIRQRLVEQLGGVHEYMLSHFRERWDLDEDLYALTISRNMDFLAYLIENHRDDYRERLKRGGVVDKLEEQDEKRQRTVRLAGIEIPEAFLQPKGKASES